ncbi:MAG: dephospho-CoA kinase, partial [Muribaculaceae bacterium]|nr:dephospho-CoA kinase [Muribaculaceae bacterium]
DRMVDSIWLVDAPEQVRIDRVMKRNALTAEQVKARIEAQRREFESLPAEKVSLVSNDGLHPLLPQIEFLLKTILNTHA